MFQRIFHLNIYFSVMEPIIEEEVEYIPVEKKIT